MPKKPNTYNGNPNIKGDGVEQNFTPEQVAEYTKCMTDISYFCEKYVKVVQLGKGLVPFQLRGYQSKLCKQLTDERFNIVLAPRQSGKSITSVAWLCHYICFNEHKKVAILANKGAIAREMLSRLTQMIEHLPFFLQPGCRVLNKGNIVFSNGSEIIAVATSSSSVRGLSLDCVTGDTKVVLCDDEENVYFTTIANSSMINTNMEKKFHFVYLTRNNVNDKIYVGYHGTSNKNDGYIGSGTLLIKAVEKYGKGSFTTSILKEFDTAKEALEYEKEIVNEEFVNREDTYNVSIGGGACILYGESNGFYGKKHSDETRGKMSEKAKTRKVSNETREKISKAQSSVWTPERRSAAGERNRNREVSNETREKISKANLGKTVSEEARAKASIKQKQNWETDEEFRNKMLTVLSSPERKKKISKALKGKKLSPERVNKVNRNPEKIRKTADKHRGMKRSKESRERMSLAKQGRKALNAGKKYFHDPSTGSGGYFLDLSEVPGGWVHGTYKKK